MTGDGPMRDCCYELTRAQLLRRLARTDLERLQWLDEARRFTIMLRDAPTVSGLEVRDSRPPDA